MRSQTSLLAFSFCLLAGCASTPDNGVSSADFFGVSQRSGENWSAALDSPKRNAVALSLAGAAAALQINGTDHHSQRVLAKHGYGPGGSPQTLSNIGTVTLLGSALITPLLFAPHPGTGVPQQDYAATALYAFGAGIAVNQIVKAATSRTRPDGTSGSFYSGHTTTSFTGAQLLYRMYGWEVGAPAYAAASLVGLYRVENSDHFPSDVLVGAAMGIWLTDVIYDKNHGEKGLYTNAYPVSVAPLLDQGRLGLAMTWSW